MTSRPDLTGYSRAQIALHWAVAALVAAQYLFKDSISRAWEAVLSGKPLAFDPLIMAHVAGGVLILALVVWRLALRVTRGVPAAPEGEPALLATAGHIAHFAFYAVLAGLSLSGVLAWFQGLETAASLHNVLKSVLILLLVLHVCAVIVHRVVFRSGLMSRMVWAKN